MAAISANENGDSASQPDAEAQTEVRQADVPTVTALTAGTLVGDDYRILSVVKSNESSISYKAEDVNLGVPVLLKEFADPHFVVRQANGSLAPRTPRQDAAYDTARERFLREAQVLVRFRHPSIVRAHRGFDSNGTKYIVLDYEDGQTFDSWLDNLGRPPRQAELDRLVAPLLTALSSVHAAGYLHAGIRPGSILLRDGASPVLVNFAGACEMTSEQTLRPAKDKAFAAPELIGGDGRRCGPWTDIYSLAAILYLAVTGKRPAADGAHPPTHEAAHPGYRDTFLTAIDHGLAAQAGERPQSVDDWEGIRAPEDLEPDASVATALAPTLVRDASTSQAAHANATTAGSAASRTSLSRLATRVISALPEAEEETDIPAYDFERWLLPAAVVTGLLGALLFSTGMSFALAAVFQVAATGLFFLRGYMPLTRYLSHTTRSVDAIARRAEQATRNGAWMICAILVIMTVNPLFVERHITATSALALSTLSAIIIVPALVIAACGYLGMPVRRSMASFMAGSGNIFVLVFSILLFAGFVYTVTSTPANAVIHPALQVNRYLYIIATVACGTLGVLNFVSRIVARQRMKQADADR